MNWDERGTDIFTKRFTDVDDDEGVEIALASDFKEVMIHYEGTRVIATRIGNITGSEKANVTSGGFTEVFPLATAANRSVLTVFAPTPETTVSISVTAWR